MSTSVRVTIITGGPGPEHDASIESAIGVYEQRQPLAEDFHFQLCVITEDEEWLDPSASERYLQVYSAGGLSRTRQEFLPKQVAALVTTPYEVVCATDAVFPLIHGLIGEDGVLLGLCGALRKPYISCEILSSAICLDKAVCNAVLKHAGLPQTPNVVVLAHSSDDCAQDLLRKSDLKLPWIVKPSDGGCSIGISLVRDASELSIALAKSREHYPTSAIFVETAVQNMMELDVGVLEEDGNLITSPRGLRRNQLHRDGDEDLKQPQESHRHGGVPEWAVPAPDVPEAAVRRMQKLAKEVFCNVRASSWLRVDSFYVPSSGECFVNEINTTPSMAPGSMIFKLWNAVSVSPPDLIQIVIRHALLQSRKCYFLVSLSISKWARIDRSSF